MAPESPHDAGRRRMTAVGCGPCRLRRPPTAAGNLVPTSGRARRPAETLRASHADREGWRARRMKYRRIARRLASDGAETARAALRPAWRWNARPDVRARTGRGP